MLQNRQIINLLQIKTIKQKVLENGIRHFENA